MHFLSPPLSGAARRAAPGRAAVLLGGTVRLRATAGECGRRAESEAIRAGVQGGGESGQRSVREGQVQDERHLRHAQGQRHPDGPLRLRGPHLQPGEHLLSHDPSNLTQKCLIPAPPWAWFCRRWSHDRWGRKRPKLLQLSRWNETLPVYLSQ